MSLALSASALAQGAAAPPPFAPDMSPGPPPMAGPPAAQAPAPPSGGPPCMNDFVPLRQEAEKRAGAIRAAAERKADRGEICKLITRFSEAEGKFAKYIETNQTWCGIPPQVVVQVRTNHAKTLKTRTQVCSNAGPMGPQGPTVPPGPGLSDALGTNRAPSATNTTTGKGGTYDTLSGNPIK